MIEAPPDQPIAAAEGPNSGRGLRFRLWLGITTAGALVFRVLYVLLVTRYENKALYDNAFYDLEALGLATGRFFPKFFGHGLEAGHPPMTSFLITPVTYFFGLTQSATPQRLTMAVLGTAVVFFVGLLGRRVAGPLVGIVAAVIAALYPNMWIPNGIVMSETVSMLFTVLAVLGVYWFLDSPSIWKSLLIGIALGLDMLTRAELILLLPLLLLPALFALKAVAWKRRLVFVGTMLLISLVVISPWVVRNLTSFKDPTFLSTGEGPVMLGANCPQTYYGPATGSWSLLCSLNVTPAEDQSVQSARQFDKGLQYLEGHESRLPVVVAARVGRVWDVYEPIQMVDTEVNEGRPAPASLAGLICYYVLIPFAVAGVVILRRRSVRVWPLLASGAAVTVIAATGYGLVRFRAEFEVSLVVLAAVSMVAGAGRLADLRGRRTP